jgi:hypothetical protein
MIGKIYIIGYETKQQRKERKLKERKQRFIDYKRGWTRRNKERHYQYVLKCYHKYCDVCGRDYHDIYSHRLSQKHKDVVLMKDLIAQFKDIEQKILNAPKN